MLSKKTNQKVYKTALYLRISKDDGDKAESDSIGNQRLLIKDFLKEKSEFKVMDEFVDDGYSGSNFERPAFKRLYEDVEKGLIDCIVVKDLSRLGRNYIEMGRYLEQIFPALGVRLIAINDRYDGIDSWQNGDNITVPIKNLMNDVYCKDISIKIKSQLEVRRKRGDYVGNFLPYGYQKSAENHAKIEIDEAAATVVKQIFRWKMEGITVSKIAERLNDMGVDSPLEHKRKNGERISDNFKRNHTAKWSPNAVTRIIRNEIYTGNLQQGKSKKVDYRSKQIIEQPKEKWVCVEDNHEAIVDKKLFELVNGVLNQDTRTAPGQNNIYLFSGLLECGDCHNSMVRRTASSKGKKYFYFICDSYKKDKSCTTHNISCDKVYKIVFDAIKLQINLVLDADEFVKSVEQIPVNEGRIKILEHQIVSVTEQIEKYKNIRTKLYEDYCESVLTRKDYNEYVELYGKKIRICQEKLQELKKQRHIKESEKLDCTWMTYFKKYKNIEELTRPVVIELIDKIYVYDSGRIEITFRFQDKLDEIMRCKEGVEMEKQVREA